MALPGAERRSSGWKCSKTTLPEEDALSLLKEFAELKRKEREKDPVVRRLKNKYKLKPSAYSSPGNILHTGRQLTRTPGPGVLPLLPSQDFEPWDSGEKSFEQLRSFLVEEIDNVVPCGKQLPRTPVLYAKPDRCPVLREIQPNAKNVGSSQTLSRTVCKSDVCNTTQILSNEEVAHISHNGRENDIPVAEVTAHKVMAVPDTERRVSGWKCSKTALREEDAINLLKEFAELKRKERVNYPNVIDVKKKSKLKPSAYPSPGKILHTGRQLLRSPAPGVLPLLPSKIFQSQEPGNESFQQLRSFADKDLKNVVPCGKQLPRTPEPCLVPREVQPNTKDVISSQRLSQTVPNRSGRCNTNESPEELNMPDSSNDLESNNPETLEDGKISSHHTGNIRRISELPVQGLNQIRISGVLKKMSGYECRSEDLEFLTCMKTQEKAKALKEELLCLRKHLAATKLDKELVIAKKDKIEDDIQRMKSAREQTLCLGRAFLSRTLDAASVQNLPPEDVFKQLNHLTVQDVHQQERAQLQAAQKELSRRRQNEASVRRHLDHTKSSLISKIESRKKCVNTSEKRIQQLNHEVVTLKTQIEKAEAKKSELKESVKQKREKISQFLEQSSIPTQKDISEEDQDRMNRSMQRILYRKKLYLEREWILQKLRRDLK